MFGQPFARYSLRSYITIFGALFSNVVIDDGRGGTKKVPCTHADKEYFWKVLQDYPSKREIPPTSNNIAQVGAYLPRMSYQIIGAPAYDSTRKLNQLNEVIVSDPQTNEVTRMFQPVPYTIPFELSIWTRYYRDMLQIVEQILPFFQPHYNVTVREYPDMNVTEYDVPIIFTGITDEDETEGSPPSRRVKRWSLTFELKGHLAPPVFDPTGTVETVVVDFYGNEADPDTDDPLDGFEETE